MGVIFDLDKRVVFGVWLLLILLTAVFLRIYQLDSVPPGLTHDEADHGITAVSILEGRRAIYFTVGHGREPLFDYATAGLMALLGQTSWVLRATAVFFSVLMIVAMFAWSRLAFNKRVALFTAAGLAVGFWPVMAGRQGLRSITLPPLFALALYFFWKGLRKLEIGDWRSETKDSFHFPLFTSHFSLFLLSGLFLGFTFYSYIPARGLWLLFPLLLLLGGLADRDWLQRVWPGTVGLLAVAGGAAAPLFIYLRANPEAEIRIGELSEPITALFRGDFSLLWSNVKAGLAILTVTGDTAWRYNIPGRPLLGPVLGLLFYAGIVLAIWQVIRGENRSVAKPSTKLAHMAALIWLLGGLAPVLITGADLSMTQGMGMQPVLYLFPALALDYLWRLQIGNRSIRAVAVLLLFGGTAVITMQDYFGEWANAPAVRVQYESTMTTVMHYLDEQSPVETAVSTITPEPFHTPALAQMTLQSEAVRPRWFDGRGSLLVPQAEGALLVFSGFAPLPDALEPYLATAVLQDTLPLRPDDQDRPIWVYRVTPSEAVAAWQAWLTLQSAQFGSAATLMGYDLRANRLAVGEMVQLTTVWQLQHASPDLRLFTHLVGPDGVPLAQADRLDAPSGSWVTGDWLVQLHTFAVPPGTAVGSYPLAIGLYRCLDAACEQTERLAVQQDGVALGDKLQLTELVITE